MTRNHFAVALASALFSFALAPDLARADMVALADGQPWSAVLAGGRTAKMRFNPDGSVRVGGFLGMRMQWTATSDGMCLEGGPGGRQCVVLQRTANGFVGTDGAGATIISLSR